MTLVSHVGSVIGREFTFSVSLKVARVNCQGSKAASDCSLTNVDYFNQVVSRLHCSPGKDPEPHMSRCLKELLL